MLTFANFQMLTQPICAMQIIDYFSILTRILSLLYSYLVRTDPADVARVESKTFICTEKKYATVPHLKDGVKGILGQWISPEALDKELNDRFPGCMKGRVMYVIPYSMGPIGSPLSKIGVQLTDFNYVVLSMRIMARVSSKIWNILGDEDFVQCVHSIGAPRPVESEWSFNSDMMTINFKFCNKILKYRNRGFNINPSVLMFNIPKLSRENSEPLAV